ncbi:hypothetical protein F2Q69_00029075 [Brassica cretica]|uniref:Uncharacterized protein n=1 Tax=Brassica cretica TaxID=69181 RepID=A0A8S9SAW2_BRACR|nr:hypothetical protein F2Q69_00029075 [Brassica cretica]
MATEKAIENRLTLLQFLATIFVVESVSDDRKGFSQRFSPTMSSISMRDPLSLRDGTVEKRLKRLEELEKEAPADPVQEEYERQIESMEAEADDEDLWNGHTMPTMFSDELIKDVQSH